MAPRSGYRALARQADSPEPPWAPPAELEGGEKDERPAKVARLSWHWIAHAGSAAAVAGLLVMLALSAAGDGAARCWDRHNYYCKAPAPTTTRVPDAAAGCVCKS